MAVSYRVTDAGLALVPAFDALISWAATNLPA
jgi:DNA-binding HxlR family transcriptional regulator